MKKIIYNIAIITQDKQREFISRGFIILEDNFIVSVGSGSMPISDDDFDEVIDGAGLLVTPGLINAHVHLGETIYKDFLPEIMTLEEYLVLTEKLVKKYPFIETERKTIGEYSAWHLAQNGTSTIAGGRVYDSAKSLGLRSVSGYVIMKSEKLAKFAVNITKQYEAERAENINDNLNKSALFVHSLSHVSPAEMLEVKSLVSKFPNTPVMIHVAETQEQEELVAAQFVHGSVLALKRMGMLNKGMLLIHGNWLTNQELNLIKQSESSIVHCLSSNIRVADRIFNIDRVFGRDINVCLATDGIATAGTFSVLEEAKSVYWRSREAGRKPLTVQKIFDMITVNAARALGLEFQIGSIEVGKKADLAFWINPLLDNKETNPLENLISDEKPADLQCLMIDGKFVVWYKELLTNNKKEIINKFRTLTKKIKELEHENNIGEPAL